MKKIIILTGMILSIGITFCFAQGNETITITTYYPSPFGVYKELKAERVVLGNVKEYCWGKNCGSGVNLSDLEGNEATVYLTRSLWIDTKGEVTTGKKGIIVFYYPEGTEDTFNMIQYFNPDHGNIFIKGKEQAIIIKSADEAYSTIAHLAVDGPIISFRSLAGGLSGLDFPPSIDDTDGKGSFPVLQYFSPNNANIYLYGRSANATGGNNRQALLVKTADSAFSPTADFIIENGRIGIGTTPEKELHVEGDAKVEGNATITGTLYVSHIKGADIAEMVLTKENVESGDVVVIDTQMDEGVVKSNQPYSPLVAGVISESPGIVIGGGEKNKKGKYKPLGLKGRVLCKVTNEGGTIKRGDLLVTSSKPGYAMKADPKKITLPTQIVGIALQNLDEKKEEGKIMILIK